MDHVKIEIGLGRFEAFHDHWSAARLVGARVGGRLVSVIHDRVGCGAFVGVPVDALGVQQMQIRLGCRHAGMPEQITQNQQRVSLGQVERQGIIAAGVHDQFRGLLVVAADQTFQTGNRRCSNPANALPRPDC